MGYMRARRTIKIAPGVKVNVNKRSVSATVGTKGAHYTKSTNGTTTKTVGAPGTGLSYVDRKGSTRRKSRQADPELGRVGRLFAAAIGIACGVGFVVLMVVALHG